MPDFERPEVMKGETTKVRTAHGNLYVTVNFSEDGKPMEVFSVLGKEGSCDFAHMEAITRLASKCLQGGVPVSEIVRQLRSITCHPYMEGSEKGNMSPSDAIGIVLSKYDKKEEK